MKLYHYELDLVSDFLLNEFALSGKHNRMRMKFIKLLKLKKQEYEEYRMQLIKEHARLDEHGEVQTIEKDGQTIADIVDIAAFNQALSELLAEEAHIEETEEHREMLLVLKDIVTECTTAFKGDQAALHDYLCDKLEQVQ